MIPAILEALSDGCADCAVTLRRGKGKVHCPLHSDTTGSLDVQEGDDGKPLLYCHQCHNSAGVIENLRERGIWPALRVINGGATQAKKVVDAYPYVDRDGTLLYREIRYEPKDFRLQAADLSWSIEGIKRVLYNLPAVIAAVAERKRIWIVEGAKDADALIDLGLVATTNVGGAGKFLEEYAADLIQADVVLIADKDEPGRAHVKDAAQKLDVAVRSIRIIEMPGKAKDVSDWLAAGGTRETLEAFADMADEWQATERTVFTTKDLAAEYREVMLKRKAGDPNEIGWPIGLGPLDKEMVYSPGDVMLVAAATGTGKTSFLQSLERRATVPTMFFSVEMSRKQLMNREIAARTGIDSWKIRRGALSETEFAQVMDELDRFEQEDNRALVDNSALTTAALENILRVYRVKYGVKVAFVDHIQRLADKNTESERVRMSDIAKALSRIARQTDTQIVAACQVNREGSRSSGEPPYKNELLESGYLEQEASVILALGRAEGATATKLAVRKNRHGLDGFTVNLVFDLTHNDYLLQSEARVSGQRQPQEVPF